MWFRSCRPRSSSILVVVVLSPTGPTTSSAIGRARPRESGAVAMGSVGAGTGAVAGGLQGGVGTASITLESGIVVGALAVVNSAGQVISPATGLPRFHEGIRLRRPPAAQRQALIEATRVPPTPLNTTIGVVATVAALTKPECRKMAAVAHDGLARAIRPVHSLFDGDTIFCLSTAEHTIAADEAAGTASPRHASGRSQYACSLPPPIALPSPAHVP